jgi:glucose/arabinose dehydrogenase
MALISIMALNSKRRRRLMSLLLAVPLASPLGQVFASTTAEQMYYGFCASCHGQEMSGGLGPALNNNQWKHGATDEDLTRVIKKGVPKAGMPAWEKSLSDDNIRALIILIRERTAQKSAAAIVAAPTDALTAAGYTFSLEKVAEASGELWAMDFLADGRVIATQKSGQLWVFEKDGKAQEITGIPAVWTKGQGGLLQVQRHPDTASGWIYLTLSDPSTKGAMTKVVRGKIEGNRWVGEQTIYSADAAFYTDAGVHFGSRMVFQNDYVFFSVGDRGQQELAQDLSRPNGKIHRLHADGRVPEDNPFAKDKNALPTIWSYGHRNPQGLALQPGTGALWDAEHGPRGGDEVNRINKGANYGWPVVTYGMNYNGTPITGLTHKPGMEQPQHYWVPSIAVSAINFYTGERFPGWRNHLLVASLAKEQLRLLRIDGDKVVADELLLQGRGRIRDVVNGPDGYPYIVTASTIFRLVPKS